MIIQLQRSIFLLFYSILLLVFCHFIFCRKVFSLFWFSTIWKYISSSWSLYFWSLLYYYSVSRSATLHLLSTSVFSKNSSTHPIAYLSASSYACHLFYGQLDYCTSTSFRLFFNVWRLSRYFKHLAWEDMTDPLSTLHHQYSAVSIAFILSKNIPIAPYPVFSW